MVHCKKPKKCAFCRNRLSLKVNSFGKLSQSKFHLINRKNAGSQLAISINRPNNLKPNRKKRKLTTQRKLKH